MTALRKLLDRYGARYRRHKTRILFHKLFIEPTEPSITQARKAHKSGAKEGLKRRQELVHAALRGRA